MPSRSTTTPTPPVGVVGLGLMGAALCERLLDDGFHVVVHNRTRDKAEPLIQRGAHWSENPFQECDRIIVSLYTTEVVQKVLKQMESGFRTGQIVLDTTTGDPQLTNALGTRLAEHGVEYLEVPISGSSEQTRRKLSTAIVAGPQPAYEACRDLLACLAAKTFYVGPWGNGVRMKLVTNLVLGLNRAVLAEGLVFADAIGLSMRDALEVLINSPAYSRTMEGKGPKMVSGDFTPQAKLSQHIKDVEIILEDAAAGGQSLPLSSLHLELLERAEAAGLGELDNSVIMRVIEELRGAPAAESSPNGAKGLPRDPAKRTGAHPKGALRP